MSLRCYRWTMRVQVQVEGINYNIRWQEFKKGMSFFVPCLDPPRAKAQVLAVTRRLRIKVLTKIVVVQGIRGLRIWRL